MKAKPLKPFLVRLLDDWGVDLGALVFLAGALVAMYVK
jgi:hypothetical protein